MKYKAFIPTNMYLFVNDTDDEKQKILFVDIRGIWPDGAMGIDCYYKSHQAKFLKMPDSAIEAIAGYNETKTEDSITLFETVFPRGFNNIY